MGLAPSVVVYDELGQSESRDLLDALDTAMGKREEPLMIIISTQAATDIAPLSTLIDYGLRIHRGEITDPSFHLTLYAAPLDADPWSPKSWRLANPALNDFRSLDDVKRLALQAQRMPSAEMSFRNLILNQRVDTTVQFIDARSWSACGDVELYLPGLRGLPCYAGLDLAASKDLTALVLAFVNDDGEYVTLPFCWLPGETLQEAMDRDHMPYAVWAKDGHLLTFPGRTTDPKAVALKIAELHGTLQHSSVGVRSLADRRHQARARRDWVQCRAGAFRPRLQRHGSSRRHARAPGRGGQTAARQSSGAVDVPRSMRRLSVDAAGNRKLSKREVDRPDRCAGRDSAWR